MLHEAASKFGLPAVSESGLLLLSENLDAFAARSLSARDARESLDIMSYLWHDDLTGRLLASEIIAAADRGVSIRILLDDINSVGNDATYLALNSHPNIALKLFNASRRRGGMVDRAIELMVRGFAMTRRMHNKAWLVDSKLAIVGGRNIGNAYFDAAETNFRDLDVLLSGAAVKQTETIFEQFWQSDESAPIDRLSKRRPRDLDAFRSELAELVASDKAKPYLDRVHDRLSIGDLVLGAGGMHIATVADVISDPPEKVTGMRRRNWLMKTLLPLIASAKESLEIISPYFIPGVRGAARLAEFVDNGVSVSILTNSLAATDVAAVHGAYANYRVPLLKHGIKLFELQPFDRQREISVFGSKGASLHTKAFTIDSHTGFIGSFNFDPRSVSLNTEMGVVFEQPDLVAEMRRLFQIETSSRVSYRLSLRDEELCWEGDVDGKHRHFAYEPEASLARRVLAAIVGLLPIESQL